MEALKKAIDIIGSQSALAKAIGCAPQDVNNWLRRGNVTAERCIDIERATDGVVTCEELRPDLADRWAYLRGSAHQKAA